MCVTISSWDWWWSIIHLLPVRRARDAGASDVLERFWVRLIGSWQCSIILGNTWQYWQHWQYYVILGNTVNSMLMMAILTSVHMWCLRCLNQDRLAHVRVRKMNWLGVRILFFCECFAIWFLTIFTGIRLQYCNTVCIWRNEGFMENVLDLNSTWNPRSPHSPSPPSLIWGKVTISCLRSPGLPLLTF